MQPNSQVFDERLALYKSSGASSSGPEKVFFFFLSCNLPSAVLYVLYTALLQ